MRERKMKLYNEKIKLWSSLASSNSSVIECFRGRMQTEPDRRPLEDYSCEKAKKKRPKNLKFCREENEKLILVEKTCLFFGKIFSLIYSIFAAFNTYLVMNELVFMLIILSKERCPNILTQQSNSDVTNIMAPTMFFCYRCYYVIPEE